MRKLKIATTWISLLVMTILFASCSITSENDMNQDKKVLTESMIKTNSIFRPTFDTAEGTYSAGTAVAVSIDGYKTPIIITAMHLFGPNGGLENDIPATLLPEFVKKTTFNDLFTGSFICESKNALLISDAMPNPEVGKDVAAFSCDSKDISTVSAYEIDDKRLKEGDRVWLVASISDGNSDTSKLHEAEVVNSEDDMLLFKYENSDLNLTASSGAPILNADGKIVGINIGGGKDGADLFGLANPSWSFKKMLIDAMEKGNKE